MNEVYIQVPVLPGTVLAEDKDLAQSLREDKLMPALAASNAVVLDFAAVGVATQSFVHSLIAEPYRNYYSSFFDLVEFRNARPAVREVILLVVDYLESSRRTAS